MKKRLTQRTVQTIDKYYSFLEVVYKELGKKNNNFLFTEQFKKHKINSRISGILIKKGIIKNSGSCKFPDYSWNTIEPSKQMANAVRLEVCKIGKIHKERKDNAVEKNTSISSIRGKRELIETKIIKKTTPKRIIKKDIKESFSIKIFGFKIFSVTKD